jgi:2-phospho-L-lactate guanylyltransferase (CobY/MobA/RfbA family)
MKTNHDFKSMARDLEQNGMNREQVERYERAFMAAKVAAVAVVCASYGVDEGAMLEALMDSRNLNEEVQRLVARMENSPAFVAHIHSDFRF